LSSNEGWGLSLTEAILTGTPILANVTGGMQDQMGFEDENGEWYTPSLNVLSNNMRTYSKCGDWVFPVYPKVSTIEGSIQTPYIYNDICSQDDVAEKLLEAYNLGKEELKRRGNLGREWAMNKDVGFTSEIMANRITDALDELFGKWEPREKYELILI
jgi:glycosyltransferase involved in cell wall biosynthesis